MKSIFKRLSVFLIIALTINGCLNFEEPEKEGFTPETMKYVDKILEENNTDTYDIYIENYTTSSGLGGPKGYYLRPHVNGIIVLTNTIDSLRIHGVYRKNTYGYGNSRGMVDLDCMGIAAISIDDTLDSICIITDSVIIMPKLGLGFSNLTHLPPEIGKLRLQALDITYNDITTLPIEVMQLLDPPNYYPYTKILLSNQKNFVFDSLYLIH